MWWRLAGRAISRSRHRTMATLRGCRRLIGQCSRRWEGRDRRARRVRRGRRGRQGSRDQLDLRERRERTAQTGLRVRRDWRIAGRTRPRRIMRWADVVLWLGASWASLDRVEPRQYAGSEPGVLGRADAARAIGSHRRDGCGRAHGCDRGAGAGGSGGADRCARRAGNRRAGWRAGVDRCDRSQGLSGPAGRRGLRGRWAVVSGLVRLNRELCAGGWGDVSGVGLRFAGRGKPWKYSGPESGAVDDVRGCRSGRGHWRDGGQRGRLGRRVRSGHRDWRGQLARRERQGRKNLRWQTTWGIMRRLRVTRSRMR